MRVCSSLLAARFNTEDPHWIQEAVSAAEESVGELRKQAVPIDLEAGFRNREARYDGTVPVEKPAVRWDTETTVRNREVSSDGLPVREFVIENRIDLAETVIEDQGIIQPFKGTVSMQRPEALPPKLKLKMRL